MFSPVEVQVKIKFMTKVYQLCEIISLMVDIILFTSAIVNLKFLFHIRL